MESLAAFFASDERSYYSRTDSEGLRTLVHISSGYPTNYLLELTLRENANKRQVLLSTIKVITSVKEIKMYKHSKRALRDNCFRWV